MIAGSQRMKMTAGLLGNLLPGKATLDPVHCPGFHRYGIVVACIRITYPPLIYWFWSEVNGILLDTLSFVQVLFFGFYT